MSRYLALLLCTLPFAASAEDSAPERGTELPDTCGAAAFRDLVGQPDTALDGVTLPDPHRVIAWGSVVTLEYDPARLVIHLAEDGTIETVTCG
jgi:hypothetical protein